MKNIPEIHPQEIKLLRIMSKNMKRKYIKKGAVYKLEEVQAIWKRTTVYTMLTRMKERGILKEEDGMLSIVYSYDEIRKNKLRQLAYELYDGDMKALAKDIQEECR